MPSDWKRQALLDERDRLLGDVRLLEQEAERLGAARDRANAALEERNAQLQQLTDRQIDLSESVGARGRGSQPTQVDQAAYARLDAARDRVLGGWRDWVKAGPRGIIRGRLRVTEAFERDPSDAESLVRQNGRALIDTRNELARIERELAALEPEPEEPPAPSRSAFDAIRARLGA